MCLQDRSWADWEDMDYQKAAATEELTRAQAEIEQLHEDKGLLEAKVSRLAGVIRSNGHDPTDVLVGVSTGYCRSRNVDSPTVANTINATWISPQNQVTTMHGERGYTESVAAAGVRSVATGAPSTNGCSTVRTRAKTLQQLVPESVKRSQTHQGGVQYNPEHEISLPGGASYEDLGSGSTTLETLPPVAATFSQNSSEPPDPAEYALFTARVIAHHLPVHAHARSVLLSSSSTTSLVVLVYYLYPLV